MKMETNTHRNHQLLGFTDRTRDLIEKVKEINSVGLPANEKYLGWSESSRICFSSKETKSAIVIAGRGMVQ